MTSAQDAYDELCAYSLAHRGPAFIHQHVVDAFGAQNAGEHTTRVQLAFALIGLYLHLERQFSGRQVQRAHAHLAKRSRTWPAFSQPADRGSFTVVDVLAAREGAERDTAIERWCATVWEAYGESRTAVIELVALHEIPTH